MVKIQEIEVKSVMTKSNLPVADFSVNPYVGCLHGCKYCYASFMKRFTNHPEPWGEFIDVKYWPEIKNAKRYAGKEAFFGSVTDCYQPHEAKYKRTRALLEQLQGSGISVGTASGQWHQREHRHEVGPCVARPRPHQDLPSCPCVMEHQHTRRVVPS